jgi:hypothetical protein
MIALSMRRRTILKPRNPRPLNHLGQQCRAAQRLPCVGSKSEVRQKPSSSSFQSSGRGDSRSGATRAQKSRALAQRDGAYTKSTFSIWVKPFPTSRAVPYVTTTPLTSCFGGTHRQPTTCSLEIMLFRPPPFFHSSRPISIRRPQIMC